MDFRNFCCCWRDAFDWRFAADEGIEDAWGVVEVKRVASDAERGILKASDANERRGIKLWLRALIFYIWLVNYQETFFEFP